MITGYTIINYATIYAWRSIQWVSSGPAINAKIILQPIWKRAVDSLYEQLSFKYFLNDAFVRDSTKTVERFWLLQTWMVLAIILWVTSEKKALLGKYFK